MYVALTIPRWGVSAIRWSQCERHCLGLRLTSEVNRDDRASAPYFCSLRQTACERGGFPTSVKMPKYVISDTQDETQQALDPEGTNAKVSFNNSEGSPAQEKSRISRGKWSGNKQWNSIELNNGYNRFFHNVVITHLHSLTAAGL